MAFTALITLSSAGSDTGPFNLYSNLDAYSAAFQTGVSRAALLSGYTSLLVPDGTETIRVKSENVLCANYVDMTFPPPEEYTLQITNPGSGFSSTYQLGGTFNTGDVVVIRATWNGFGGTVPPSNSGNAELFLSNPNAVVSDFDTSSCVPVGSSLSWSLTTEITFNYNVANSSFLTTATVNNASASSSTVTASVISVNGIAVSGVSVIGNKSSQSAPSC
jgi:hypothetical protein